MFFLNVHKNKSNKNISLITKIVLVILLVCVLSDKTGAFNVSHNFSRMNIVNIDFFANELMLFGRISFDYSLFIALGFVGIVITTLFALCCYMVSANKNVEETGSVKEFSYEIENIDNLRTNNIYLLNNKFIC